MKKDKKKYLIIGGAGVFALHLIRRLVHNDNNEVISVGRSPEKNDHFTLGITSKNFKNYKYIQLHMTFENDMLLEIIENFKPNYIVNFAALAYATSWEKSYRYYDTNVTAVTKICEYLYNKNYLDQFLQIGSSEIYGATKKPALETDLPNPTSPYAVSKLSCDQHLLTLYNHLKFPVNIIRPCNCYGPTQLMYRIIPKAILNGLNGIKFPLEGGGKAMKSFMHADDLASAILKILKSKKYGEIYNAGVDKPITMKEIVQKISQKLDLEFNDFVKIVPGRKTEDKIYWVNSNKIKKNLNWKPNITFDEGLDDCIKWVKENNNLLLQENTSFKFKA